MIPPGGPSLAGRPTIEGFAGPTSCHLPANPKEAAASYAVRGPVLRIVIRLERLMPGGSALGELFVQDAPGGRPAARLDGHDALVRFVPGPDTVAYILEAQGPGGSVSRRLALDFGMGGLEVRGPVRRVRLGPRRERYEVDLVRAKAVVQVHILDRRADGYETGNSARVDGALVVSDPPKVWNHEGRRRMSATFTYQARIRDCAGERIVESRADLPAE